jgi:hypothetical protein
VKYRTTNHETCRLCSRTKELQQSHLIPRGVYKTLRASNDRNPNPLVVTDEASHSTSQQVQDYLLCGDCEQLFNKRGENWMLANCYRQNGAFELREKLLQATPEHATEDLRVYAAANIPGICRDNLVYFAASVFWRAAVHEWSVPGTANKTRISLGRYEDQLGKFLRDEAPFPDDMVLTVRVSSMSSLLEVATLPQSRTDDGYHVHDFTIPGVAFALLVGARIPKEYRRFCTAQSPEGFVFISRELDQEFVRFMISARGMYR